jgi:hypothetical protein
MPAQDPVRVEVAAVECDDASGSEPLRRHDERGVGQTHRVTGVGLHQLEGAREPAGIEEQDGGPGVPDQMFTWRWNASFFSSLGRFAGSLMTVSYRSYFRRS